MTRHVIGLAHELQRQGHTVCVLAPCSAQPPYAPLAGLLRPLSSHVVAAPYSGAVSHICLDPRLHSRIYWLLRREQIEIMHLHEPLAPGVSWAALSAAHRIPGLRIVGAFHAYREGPNRLYRWAHPLWRARMALLDGTIAVSTATASFWNQFVDINFRLIPNGIERQWLRPPSPPLHKTAVEVLFVGRLEPRKGLDVLLKAWRHIERRVPQARLTIAGPDAPHTRAVYQRLAADLGLRRLRFIGPQTETDLMARYRQADIVCAPARGFESFGMVILEAMAASVPVVASDIAGFRTLITPGHEGLLAPAGDAQGLAAALLTLLHDPERRHRLGEQGHRTAERYAWDAVVPHLLDYFDEISRQPRRRHAQSC